jgi:hypothetical protein
MDPVYLREAERIMAIVIAGMAIYLGYRLFLDVKSKTDNEGKFQLPGGTGIYLTRVGPGIFFALFGALILWVSFRSPITIGGPADPQDRSRYEGFGSNAAANYSPASPQKRQQLKLDLEFIKKTLPGLWKPDLTEAQRTDLEILIPKIKLSLMRSAWDEKWGDFGKFQDWVESGFKAPIPSQLEDPAAYYRSKEEPVK